jgi:hypothetical protein
LPRGVIESLSLSIFCQRVRALRAFRVKRATAGATGGLVREFLDLVN